MSAVPGSLPGTLQRPGLAWPGRARRSAVTLDGTIDIGRDSLGIDDEPLGLPIALPVSATVTLIRGMEVGVRGVSRSTPATSPSLPRSSPRTTVECVSRCSVNRSV